MDISDADRIGVSLSVEGNAVSSSIAKKIPVPPTASPQDRVYIVQSWFNLLADKPTVRREPKATPPAETPNTREPDDLERILNEARHRN